MGPGASQAILSFLVEKGLRKCVHIDLGFTGCCDASLVLVAGPAVDGDMVIEEDGLVISIDPETYKLTGDINIAYTDEPGRKGFSITSVKPVSEWDGFGVCDIKI